MHHAEPPSLRTGLVRVEAYTGAGNAWDRFVRRSPAGTVFHLAAWKDVLEGAFGYRSHYLVARRGDDIVGVLPLCELSQPLGGRCLMSLPFAVEAGVCASDREAQGALEAAAIELGVAAGAAYVELRDELGNSEFVAQDGPYVRFRRELAASDEENLIAVPRKQRRMIRVGQRSGLTARIGSDGIEVFHDLYARSVRRLGTPVFSCSYFRRLLECFGEACVLLTVYHDKTPAAAVLSFVYNDTVMPYYAGSRSDFHRYAVNDFLYWELMRYAVRRGVRTFDFGRSKQGSGAYAFKQHWGFAAEPLSYRVYSCGGRRPPRRSLNDKPMELLRRAWSRVPLPLTKLLGPPIIRRLGPFYT